ncbi:hypothetical protein [Flavobacterium aestuarii]|uniref:hypothetical protein n=1 Tax=Flavobacterium aestuarii TaxID=3149227 RepID=UPI0032B3ED94
MKASTPSLILFFVTSILAIIFKLLDHDMLVLYTKSMIIPSLFIYYLVCNNYKISSLKAIIFLAFFVRDVFNTLRIGESAMGSFLCVLFVYVLLLCIALKEWKSFQFGFKDAIPFIFLVFFLSLICYSVLNLKLENLELDFSLYAVFGVILTLLSLISIINYIKSGSYAFFNGMLMSICFIITDVFFVLYKFYFYNYAFTLVSLITQFLSYFFMVNYFLEKDKEDGAVYS